MIGSAGEAVFFALFFLIGCAGLVAIFAALVVPEWRVNHAYVQHPCLVLDKRIGETKSEEGTLYRPEIQIEYQLGGKAYRIWTYDVRGAYSSDQHNRRAILDQFAVGETYACWYNPGDPSQAPESYYGLSTLDLLHDHQRLQSALPHVRPVERGGLRPGRHGTPAE